MNNSFKGQGSSIDEEIFLHLIIFPLHFEDLKDLKVRGRNLYRIHEFMIPILFLVLLEFSFQKGELVRILYICKIILHPLLIALLKVIFNNLCHEVI